MFQITSFVYTHLQAFTCLLGVTRKLARLLNDSLAMSFWG